MNAAESQRILSRLYTDEAYRRAFLSGKEAFYRVNQIRDEETITFLNALKPGQLEFFAKGLYAKRYHEVMLQMPGTAYLLQDIISDLFREFSKESRTYGIHRHSEEGQAFIAFIKSKQILSPQVKNVMGFEELLIRNFLQPKAWRVCRLSYNVPAFLRSLQAGEQPTLRKERLLLVFRKSKVFRLY